MNIKYIGAILIIVSCSGLGFAMAAAHRAEERQLKQLSDALSYLSGELQYRLSPLPQLCISVSRQGRGTLYRIFEALGNKLIAMCNPDASACLREVMEHADLVPPVRELMQDLGRSLGIFDLEGQLESIALIQGRCCQILDRLAQNREDRLRSYQTLGICAGAALVILFV